MALLPGLNLHLTVGRRHGRHFVTTTGLQRASLSGGVKNATQRYALPPPAVAVRNLVWLSHSGTAPLQSRQRGARRNAGMSRCAWVAEARSCSAVNSAEGHTRRVHLASCAEEGAQDPRAAIGLILRGAAAAAAQAKHERPLTQREPRQVSAPQQPNAVRP